MNLRFGTIYVFVALMTLATAGKAEATLGEPAESIARDGAAMAAAVPRAAVSRANYTVQEFSSNATTVREYLTPSGVVFAVAWNGLVHPDLKVLLGSYDEEYRSALCQQTRKRGQRHAQVKSDRVIVETWGHMRNLQGRAYLPAMVPEGVSLYEIR